MRRPREFAAAALATVLVFMQSAPHVRLTSSGDTQRHEYVKYLPVTHSGLRQVVLIVGFTHAAMCVICLRRLINAQISGQAHNLADTPC